MRRAILLGLIAIVGCRSAATRFYTLVPPPDETQPPPSAGLQLDVLPVDVPPDVDRAQMVVRQGRGELTPVDTRSWIAPLPLEIRRAFAGALTHELGVRDIAGVTAEAGVPTYRVKLAVQRFESVLGKRALIDAVWTVREAGGAAPPLVCSVRASEQARAGYDGIAEAHQRALARIAAEVALGVRAVHAGAAACPTRR